MGPPDDAYGRVTNPERYASLHPFADELIDTLTNDYVATASKASRHNFSGYPIERAVKVEPHGGGPTITIAFTAFPGLYVRFGTSKSEAYPHCGCDACDEKAQRLMEEITGSVARFVGGEFGDDRASPWPTRKKRPD